VKPIKVRGLVLREYEAGESDKRLVIFCKGQGRLLVYARGARKPSSKFMAAAQLFTYADFVLTQGHGFYALAQAQVIESFYPLREDYDRLMAAHLVAEVCEKTLWDNLESDSLLLLALKSLSILAKGKIPPIQVACVFLFRFFDVHGLRPQTDVCIICGNTMPLSLGTAKITICPEGLVCDTHKPAIHRRISTDAVFALQHILNSELAQAYQFSASEDVLQELRNAANFLWKNHFDWELRSDM